MQTYIVIGTYQFIGFYVTQYFLNQGEEVIGIDWADKDDSPYIMEEKELEIGRSANYIYFPVNKLKLLDIARQDTVFISCYDIYHGKFGNTELLLSEIGSFIEKCKKKDLSETPNIVLFMPVAEESLFQSIISAIEGIDSAKIIYLPTVYGPWQSEAMSFEVGINQQGPSVIEAAIAKEYTGDALFVSDFVNALEGVLASSDRSIQLSSNIADHWYKCAAHVFDEEIASSFAPTPKINKGSIVEVQCNTDPQEGVALQRKHNKRLSLLKKWRKAE